jgi:DNA-binding Lrp family transcriptional regulator
VKVALRSAYTRVPPAQEKRWHEEEEMVMAPQQLDDQLVRLLQTDGRATFSQLSKQHGVNRALVTNKLNEMTASQELRIVAAVHPRLLGLNAVAHLSIKLHSSAQPAVDLLSSLEGAVFVSLTTGRYGIIAELRLPTVEELYQQVELIRSCEGVAGVDVLMYKDVMRSLFLGKEPPRLDLELDTLDLRLMNELQVDGRLGFEALGEKVGLSASAARMRVLRLLEARVMQIGPIRVRTRGSNFMAFGFGITTNSDRQEAADFFSSTPGVEFIATCFGRYDLVATVGVSSQEELYEIADRLRSLPSVVSMESWLHLKIVQERYAKPLDKILANRLVAAR